MRTLEIKNILYSCAWNNQVCLICRWHHFNQDHEFLFHSYGVNTCPVCLEGLVGKDPVKIPCSHVICLTCISEWTSQERSCPMCKRQIPEDFRIQSSKIIRLDFFSYQKWLVSQWGVKDKFVNLVTCV